MRAAATDQSSLHEFLVNQSIEANQLHLLKLVTDTERSAQAPKLPSSRG
ncbi:hypothetical protein [Mycobacterium tilburgii]|nr:hypothetical protein [Mycobacterium tilburgii]